MRIDLHMHTRYSADSMNSLEDIVRKTRELGITPAITDHNSIGAHVHLRKMGFDFIPGEEVKTAEGDLIGLYLNEAIEKKTPFLETLDRIREQGGLAYLPHMYDRGRNGIADETLAKKVDIIEVHNARCLSESYNEAAEAFARKHRKYRGAGGDSHFIREIGNAYVETRDCDVSGPRGLLKALKGGKVVWKKPGFTLRGATTLVKYAKKAFGL